MKVLLVADARSIHTKRWVESLSKKGVEIILYSLYPPIDDFFKRIDVQIRVFDLFTYQGRKGMLAKFTGLARHFKAASDLKKFIKEQKPDILHAHYATSFGLVAALTGFHPFILSVWGSDVYAFPYYSKLNRWTVRYSLKKADKILSTSRIMAKQCSLFTDKDIEITPFGVDIGLFCAKPQLAVERSGFTIGTVKSLKPVYGIDVLIRAFALFLEKYGVRDAELVIIGEGTERAKLTQLAENLKISQNIKFLGNIENSLLPWYYQSFDAAAFLSRNESFGVSAIEAMACECPVITSDADGFKEVIEDGRTGIIVPREDMEAAAEAIWRLYSDHKKRVEMGRNGRIRVRKFYDWNDNVQTMLSVYKQILGKDGR